MEFSVENWLDIKAEMIPLVADHWKECNPLDAFDIDEARYDILAEGGMFQITSVRDEGKLIGYVASTITPHLNSKKLVGSFEMGWYVIPEMRKGGLGISLRKHAEKNLQAAGVQRMYAAIPSDAKLSKIMEHLGWKSTEIHYCKSLGENNGN